MKNESIPALIVALVAITGLVMVFNNTNSTGALSGEISGFGSRPGSFNIDIFSNWDQGADAGAAASQICAGSPLYSDCCRDECQKVTAGDSAFKDQCRRTCGSLWPGRIG